MKGIPFFGDALRFARDPLAFTQEAATYGGLVRVVVLGTELFLVTDPELLESLLVRHHGSLHKSVGTKSLRAVLGDGLVTSDGGHWRRQRLLVASAFTPKRIAAYAETFVSVAETVVERSFPAGQVVDVHEVMSALAFEIVGKTLFDSEVGDEDVRDVGEALHVLNDAFTSLEGFLLFPKWLPTPRIRAAHRAIATIDRSIERIVGRRRADGEDRGDLLGAMIAAKDQEGTGMTDRLLRDECVTLFLAGYETTAVALAYTLRLLGLHPDIEARVREEIDRVLGGRRATADDVPALLLTERVIREALRLYPPIWAIGREVVEPIETCGYRFEKGTRLSLSMWATHRSPRLHPDPDRFDPDRWLPERLARQPKFASLPFGGGARICVGNFFAMMEAVLVLATVLSRRRFRPITDAPLRFVPSVALRPRGGLPMRVEGLPTRAAFRGVEV